MQNLTPFWILVTSRFINVFFLEKFSSPMRYKDRSLQWQWRGLLTRRPNVFLVYFLGGSDSHPKALFTDKNSEKNAKAPEWRKLRNCWAGTVFLFVPPQKHFNWLSKVHQSMQKHHTELVNKTRPHLSTVISPLLLEWGLKLYKMKKWSLFW